MGWSELIGSRLDRYQIIAELGRGGTARVYRALDTERQIEVAIKVMPNEAEDRQSFVRRFQREIEVMGKLQHPNIIKIRGNGQTPDLVYLVMDYIAGGTLRQVFGRPLAIADAVHYIAQMADALHYAHERNIIHRDVKPSNMLVDTAEPGRIILTDFGIAKIYQQQGLTKSGTTIGTPEYMAPEQAEGQEIDPRADIYSLGCVLYEALAGRPPFVGATPVSVLYQQVHARPSYIRGFNPDVPLDLSRIVDRMLAKRPNDRFATAAQVAERLRPFLTESLPTSSTRMTEVPVHLPADPADQGFTPLDDPGGIALFLPDGGPLALNDQTPVASPTDISQLPTAPPAPSAVSQNASEITTQPLGSQPLGPQPNTPKPPSAHGQRRTVGTHSQPLHHAGSGPLPPGIGALTNDRQAGALLPLERAGNPPRQPAVSGRVPAQPRPLPPPPPPGIGPAWPTAAVPTSGQVAELTPPAWQAQASGSAWDPATDEVPTIAVPAPRLRRGQHHRQRRSPLAIMLGLVALLAVAAGGWVGIRALVGQSNTPGHPSVVQTKTPTPTPTPSPTATPTPKPSPTATPTPTLHQRLDAQAAASFRSVVLGTFQDGSCSAANGKTQFSSGQFITINLCTSSTVAPGPMNIVIRQNGAVVMAMSSPPNIYLAPNGSYYYQRSLGPGTYDALVTITLNGYQAVARDLPFTVV
jgi:serine/threonine-protein kinase